MKLTRSFRQAAITYAIKGDSMRGGEQDKVREFRFKVFIGRFS
jgi:hypothetical protein